jgi:glycosyltransferase involved in cell wall biosynthesis
LLTVSIVIPTLNSAKTLKQCLDSIAEQDYPKDKIEVIVADGGSTDGTLNIINEFSASNLQPQTPNCSFSASNLQPQTSNCSFSASSLMPQTSNCPFGASNLHPQPSNIHIVPNNLKTGEAGKAVGVKVAKGEVIALIDSDNTLPEENWLRKMIVPFIDPEIITSEPLYYTYRPDDGYITHYCALLGMNNPLCLLG